MTDLGTEPNYVLAVNTGSSSLKASLYAVESGETLSLRASFLIDRIGNPGSRRVVDIAGHPIVEQTVDSPSHSAALAALRAWLDDEGHLRRIAAVGHRVVHGGSAFRAPAAVTSKLLTALDDLVLIDPEHLPQAVAAVREIGTWSPDLPQVACFDTAFHRTMPRVAQLYPLPRRLTEGGIMRFGFHGLSCESIMHQLATEIASPIPARLIIAHLGNGSSMTAVAEGKSIETTMGFTPTGGLMMGTRTGDLDPGVLLHLIEAHGLSPAETSALLNKQSGLLGVSGNSSDMRDLLERRSTDAAAHDAIALYCYIARKAIGSLAVALGGLDLVAFTGGIGEHAAPVREEICAGLEFIGVVLDPDRNSRQDAVISGGDSRVTVRVIHTDEESVIARQALRFVMSGGQADV